MKKEMKIVTDHSIWCDKCGEYLSVTNPAMRTSYEMICLACIEKMRVALVEQVAEDKARER